MDDIDHKLVAILAADGRMTHERLAQEVRLSRPAVRERVRQLEARGVIKGYRAIVDPEAIGLPLLMLILVRTINVSCDAVARGILAASRDNAQIEACHRVSGDWCMQVQARVRSPQAFQDLIDRLRAIDGVVQTQSMLVMSTIAGPLHT